MGARSSTDFRVVAYMSAVYVVADDDGAPRLIPKRKAATGNLLRAGSDNACLWERVIRGEVESVRIGVRGMAWNGMEHSSSLGLVERAFAFSDFLLSEPMRWLELDQRPNTGPDDRPISMDPKRTTTKLNPIHTTMLWGASSSINKPEASTRFRFTDPLPLPLPRHPQARIAVVPSGSRIEHGSSGSSSSSRSIKKRRRGPGAGASIGDQHRPGGQPRGQLEPAARRAGAAGPEWQAGGGRGRRGL